MLVVFSGTVAGQERLALGSARVAGQIQTASVTQKPAEVIVDDDPIAAAKRLSDALSERLRPVEQRFREDARLRHAGTFVGLGVVASGRSEGKVR